MQAKLFEYLKNSPLVDLVVTSDLKEARSISQVALYLGYEVALLPDLRVNFGDDLRPFKEELYELFFQLSNYYQTTNEKKIVISPLRTLLNRFVKKELLSRKRVEFGDRIDLDQFKNMLFNWGYSFVNIVEERGEASFRGDIIDIFSPGEKMPFRVSLFDDEIESIRYFEPATQKSQKDELDAFELSPALFALSQDEFEEFESRIESIKSDALIKDIHSLGYWALDDKQSFDPLKELRVVKLLAYEEQIEEIFSFVEDDDKKRELLELDFIDEPKEYRDIVTSDLMSFLEFHKEKEITIIANSEAIIKQYELENFKAKRVYKPFIVNIMSDEEIIVSLNKEQKSKRRKKSNILIDELNVGDFVVHEEYGVGVFKGLVNTTVLGSRRDFIEIAYQNDEKVLLPVENIDRIDRYIGEGGSLVVIDRLGKGSFLKLKAKVRERLFEIAKDIIEIAAKRELIEAPVLQSDYEELELFRMDAGFAYTKDQIKSIEDILSDLKSGKVMDRLLSGDVGFGKTEVAMNAIFAAVKSGYQTALIAPTTLLVSQHFKTIKSRFEKYGIKIAKLDRFTSTKEKREILSGLKEAKIDLCIGTHALLGVEFANLALLIIDEEHKFGVKQKEQLKNLRSNMHILSMSATPIPRSLNMALSSIKQYSTLLTPPSEREDVRSFVKEYDEALIKEVILREKRRGGQIFYVHNRIATIEQKKKELEDILPNLSILTLHSKIPPATTEKEVLKFEKGEYDLLLSTSIVESGIHMPNVNTILIDESDRFGMADLHQLRGRVGRGKRQGYCYYLVKDKNSLSDDATKRLIALESNSFLGSGSLLAYHDLEIRGGGNLVGEAQSGHIKGIGYSLYLRMLEESINTLLNGNIESETKKEKVEIKLSISAYLSSEVVGEDRIRLELYRRLSKCESAKEVYEIEEEMLDRFGKLDTPTKQFLELIAIKILAKKRGILKISNYQENITIEFSDAKKEYLRSKSKDDDDIIDEILRYLRSDKIN